MAKRKFKFQTYDLRDLDEHTRSLVVTNEIKRMLRGKLCTVCGGSFIGQVEKDTAIVSAKRPLQFAHNYCWERDKQA